jgi:hypothetical protein
VVGAETKKLTTTQLSNLRICDEYRWGSTPLHLYGVKEESKGQGREGRREEDRRRGE